jgi:hypothetical protein
MENKDRKHYCRFQKEKGGTGMEQSELLIRVNQITGKDYTHKSLLKTIEDLCWNVVKFQEDVQIKKNIIEILKKSSREYQTTIESLIEEKEILLEQNMKLRQQNHSFQCKTTYRVYKENLELVQEVARLKGILPR